MRACPNCNTLIGDADAACGHCYSQLGQAPLLTKLSRLTLWSILISLFFFFSHAVFPLLHELRRNYYHSPPVLEALLVFFAIGKFLVPIAAFLLGISMWTVFKNSAHNLKDRNLAAIGLFLNGMIIAVFMAPIILSLGKVREHTPRHAVCRDSLRAFSLAFYMYAEDNGGLLPPIDDTKNNFIGNADLLYPEYVNEAAYFHCPQAEDFDEGPGKSFALVSNENHPEWQAGDAHPDCMTDKYYCYLGWRVTSDEEAESFFQVYDALSPEDFDKDISVSDGNGGVRTIPRLSLRSDKPADRIPNPNSDVIDPFLIPILWDRPFTHPEDFSHFYYDGIRGNVLYLDGHIESIKFGEKFPMTRTMARLLEEHTRAPIPDCEETKDTETARK